MEKQLKGNMKEFENISVEQKIRKIADFFNMEKNSYTKQKIFQHMFQVLEFSENENEFLYLLRSFKKLLNKRKIFLNQLQCKGKNILMVAIEKNFSRAIYKLIKQKFDLEKKDENGETAVFYLASIKRKPNQETEKLILSKGANLTHINNKNQTVLEKALENNFDNLVTQILNQNFELLTQKNDQGLSSLDYILNNKNQTFYKLLEQNLDDDKFKVFLNYCQQNNKLYQFVDHEEQNNFDQDYQPKNNTNEDSKKTKNKKLSFQIEQNKNFDIQQKRKQSQMNFQQQVNEKDESNINNQEIIQNYQNEISELKKRIKFFQQQNQKLKDKKQANKVEQKKSLCQVKNQKVLNKPNYQDQSIQITQTLQEQILSYQKYIQNYQNVSEESIENAFKIIKKLIVNFFGQNVEIQVAGSISNKLNMPWSDLNIHILPKNNMKYKKKDKYYKDIYEFKKTISRQHYIREFHYQRNMSLTVINFTLQQEQTSHKVELMFKYLENSIPENDQIIEKYLQHYPIAKPLYLTFKKMLHNQQLDNPKYQGLNNLCILTLIIAFLQQFGVQKDTEFQSLEQNLGSIFQNFLYFYTYQFDFSKFGIQLKKPEDEVASPFFLKNLKLNLNQLAINHPYKQNIIISKSFKRTEELQQVFTYSYFALFEKCNCSALKKHLQTQQLNDQINELKHKQSIQADDKTTVCESMLDQFQSIVVRYRKKFSKDINETGDILKLQKAELQSQISYSTKLDSVFLKKSSGQFTSQNQECPNLSLVKIFNLNLQNIILQIINFFKLNVIFINYLLIFFKRKTFCSTIIKF